MEIDDNWLSLSDNEGSEVVNEVNDSGGFEISGDNHFDSLDMDVDDYGNSGEVKDDASPADSAPPSGDILSDFLRSRGIDDPSKIQFEDDESENGISEKDFNSLSREEQMTILNELTKPGISNEESQLLNAIRNSGLTVNDYMNKFASDQIQAYSQNMQQNQERSYTVDDYSDDELYVADLKSKFPDFTDDELIAKLNTAKEDEDLFNKEVTSLRGYYENIEDQQNAEAQQAEAQRYQDLQNQLMNSARNFNEVSLDYNDPQADSLVIEDADKNQMLAYLLNQDAEGKSQLVRDLENPDALIQLAWLRTQGNNIISGMTQYWKDVVKDDRKEIARLKKRLEKYENTSTSSVVKKSRGKIDNYSQLGDDLI